MIAICRFLLAEVGPLPLDVKYAWKYSTILDHCNIIELSLQRLMAAHQSKKGIVCMQDTLSSGSGSRRRLLQVDGSQQ